ncbi:adenylate/guanylate cyclase [Amycolatopsis balhimycina DSM 5908]|uniref:Adenylate/guanylate cyclase n=1 Tax=Amycolatopsis balhimycina DSM 5908 TaxID=1081091 RepID=A0A428WFM8_AMYBA|nr:hypothetical protein [Amycolatopsis balhimycina]RSM41843.1 adenylate/guanylate cyclase [Amycolatopsis balhimycina DSM 5908]
MTAGQYPLPATLLVADLRGFGSLTNPEQLAARSALYSRLAVSFDEGGVPWDGCAHEDRGDGVLVVVPPEVPKPVLLGPVLDRLVDARRSWPRPVRIAVHAGDLHHDGLGFVGSDVNHVFRLVEATPLREALTTSGAPAAVLISDELYRGTARHGYGPGPARGYFPVPVAEKETRVTAWLTIPGADAAAERIAERARAPRRPARPAGGVALSAGGDQHVTNSLLAGRSVTGARRRRH